MPQLSAVACSILDARSPEQFVFIPDWMMKALRLRPRCADYVIHHRSPIATIADFPRARLEVLNNNTLRLCMYSEFFFSHSCADLSF